MRPLSIAALAGIAQIFALVRKGASTEYLSGVELLPDRYLVVLRSDTYQRRGFTSPRAQLENQLRLGSVNSTIVESYDNPVFHGVSVQLTTATDVIKLEELEFVESINPVFLRPAPKFIASDDFDVPPRDRAFWAHNMTGIDRLHAERYYGRDIKVAVIGTGVDYMHPALGGGIGPSYKVMGGHDFVGDAYTGDIDGPARQESSDPMDTCRGHETFVAGVIAADLDSFVGVLGVAPQARINAYRIYGCFGSTSDDIIIAAMLRAHQDGNDVITLPSAYNVGWGEGAIATVAKRIATAGRVIVVPAGDDGMEGSWYNGDIGNTPGIIHAGSAKGTNRLAYLSRHALTVRTSSYGPSNNMRLSPALVAPGQNVQSTWPVQMGHFETASGTSVAAAFVAGAAVLWLEAKGRTPTNAWTALTVFQNTACVLKNQPEAGSLIEPASHQGAGLIQVYDAIHAKGSMLPAVLALNDTAYAQLSWNIALTNFGRAKVQYNLTHIPAGTMPTIQGIEAIQSHFDLRDRYAGIDITPTTITLSAGSTGFAQVSFRSPVGLKEMMFPVYSGYIRATGDDGSKFHSTYLGVASTLNEMRSLDDTYGMRLFRDPHLRYQSRALALRSKFHTPQDLAKMEVAFRLVGGTPMCHIELVNADLGGPIQLRGLIMKVAHMPRDLPNKWSVVELRRLVGNVNIPDGEYQVRVRVLKLTGDPRQERDWQCWISSPMHVRRADN